jgi:outer membrane protein OmpA-like peptidoglycan-associated protein
VIDTSWAVYVYGSERGAAEFVLYMKDARSDEANYELFRIENRVYFASMTSALTPEDRAKLDEIAKAAEGAISAS